jgi:hypothetical protein
MTLPAALLHWRLGGMMRRESARHYMSRPVVLLLAAIALPERVEACFCARACVPKAEATVFEATVTSIGPGGEPGVTGPNVVVSLSNVVVLSGDPPRALVRTASSCDYPFRVGVRYRVEGEALATSDGRVVWASQCGATRPMWTWDLRALPTMLGWWWSGSDCRD